MSNTVWGRVLNTYLNEYEAFFNNRIKPFLDKLVPYLDCTFALCDFKVSTTNYFDDFSAKFKTERMQNTDLTFEWNIARKELYSDLTSSLNDAKRELDTFNTTLAAPVVAAKPLFHNRQSGEKFEQQSSKNVSQSETQTLPYNSDEQSKLKYSLYNRKSSLTPGLRENTLIDSRPTIRLSSPNSGG